MEKITKNEVMEASKEKRNMKKVLFAGAAVSLLSSSAFATTTTGATDQSFGDLFKVFQDWLEGNLGKLLALLGFAGTFLVYMMTHKGSVLFIGIVISLIAGGMIGISQTFFNAGASSFATY